MFLVTVRHCLHPHPSGAPPFPAPYGARTWSHSDGDSRLAPRGSVGGVPLRTCTNGVPPHRGGADSGSVCLPTTPVHTKGCTTLSVHMGRQGLTINDLPVIAKATLTRARLMRLDSVPPHGTSPPVGANALRGLSNPPYRAASGAPLRGPSAVFHHGANLESPSEWLHIRAPCGAGKGGAPDGCGGEAIPHVTINIRCGHAARNISSGSMPDETYRLRADRRGNI